MEQSLDLTELILSILKMKSRLTIGVVVLKDTVGEEERKRRKAGRES